MTDEMRALAERAVADKGWRWIPGCNPIHIEGYGYKHDRVRNWADAKAIQGNRWYIPDLTDPATLGCLLAMVREAWGDLSLSPRPGLSQGLLPVTWSLESWVIPSRDPGPTWCGSGPTEAAALVAALEAAP